METGIDPSLLELEITERVVLDTVGPARATIERLRRLGVDRALSRAGVRDGDEVTVGPMTFTWGES